MKWNVIFAAAGGFIGGLAGALFAPSVFWAMLISGAMAGAAVRVAMVLFQESEPK